jgi:hypothetical protein
MPKARLLDDIGWACGAYLMIHTKEKKKNLAANVQPPTRIFLFYDSYRFKNDLLLLWKKII